MFYLEQVNHFHLHLCSKDLLKQTFFCNQVTLLSDFFSVIKPIHSALCKDTVAFHCDNALHVEKSVSDVIVIQNPEVFSITVKHKHHGCTRLERHQSFCLNFPSGSFGYNCEYISDTYMSSYL